MLTGTLRRILIGLVPSLCCAVLSLAACNKTSPAGSSPVAPSAATASAGASGQPVASAPAAASASASGVGADSTPGATGQSADCTLQTPLVPGVPGSPGHLIPSTRNPNGQSELAALMRTMEAALKDARPLVAKGQAVGPFAQRFAKIRCSWPTNPSDRDAEFDALATAYLGAVSALDRASGAASAGAFDGVLNACRACHERACGGAIVAINALRLPGSAATDGAEPMDCKHPSPPSSPPPSR